MPLPPAPPARRRVGHPRPSARHALLLLGLLLAPAPALAQGLEVIIPQIGSGSPAYRFNEELSVFERAPDSLGPLVAEGARTVGRFQLFTSLVYTQLDFKRAEGTAIDELAIDVGGDVVALEKLQLGIIDLIAEFGVTERIEVGIDIPIVLATLETDVEDFEESGIGDIKLRGKWNFLQSDGWVPDLAVQGQLQVPSGDDEEFQGTGLTQFTAALIASDTWLDGWVSPHVNWDVELTEEADAEPGIGGERDSWNTKWVAGADVHAHERVNVSLDLLGRHKLVDDFDFGANIVDIAFGAKLNPFARFNVFAVVLVPLNRDVGLRTDATWRVGGEATFF